MSYSDDYTAPFAGDQTGQILAEPDMVALSPVTSARVVETQSGYLIVLKKADDRLALSVKRRIGTPPSSQVILTSDESTNLSRVLSDSAAGLTELPGEFSIREAPKHRGKDDLSAIYGADPGLETSPNWDEITQPLRKRKQRNNDKSLFQRGSTLFPKLKLNTLQIAGISAGVLAITLLTILGLNFTHQAGSTGPNQRPTPVEGNSPEKIDKFVRKFVTNMLDFNPDTYKSSQVKAMAVMRPELLERYWKETSFPLSKTKLSALPEKQVVKIEKVVQQPTSSVSTDIDLYAQVSTPQSQPSPLHLLLELEEDDQGNLAITEMKDASNNDQRTNK